MLFRVDRYSWPNFKVWSEGLCGAIRSLYGVPSFWFDYEANVVRTCVLSFKRDYDAPIMSSNVLMPIYWPPKNRDSAKMWQLHVRLGVLWNLCKFCNYSIELDSIIEVSKPDALQLLSVCLVKNSAYVGKKLWANTWRKSAFFINHTVLIWMWAYAVREWDYQ